MAGVSRLPQELRGQHFKSHVGNGFPVTVDDFKNVQPGDELQCEVPDGFSVSGTKSQLGKVGRQAGWALEYSQDLTPDGNVVFRIVGEFNKYYSRNKGKKVPA